MVDEQDTGRQHERRHRKLWIALLVLVTIVAGFALYIARFITARPTISHDYTGDYNTLTRPANYDPNQNAAPLYQRAFAKLSEVPAGWPSPASFRPQQDPTGAQRRLIEPWVTANAPALGLIAQAAEKPYYWVECTSFPAEVFKEAPSFRRAGFCLCYKAQLQAADGDLGAALRSITIAHKMSGQLRIGGTQIHAIIGVAIDSMACSTALALLADSPISAEPLTAFLKDFEPASPADISAFASLMGRVERIRLLGNIQQYFTDNGKGEGHIVLGQLFEDALKTRNPQTQLDEASLYFERLWLAWRHPGRKETVQRADALATLMEQASTQTPWQLHTRGDNLEAAFQRQTRNNYVLRQLGVFRIVELSWRSRVSEAALVTTVALWRYQLDKEAWPDSLEQLVQTGYLRAVPPDPYGDGPLVYRPAGATFVLYSWGRDFDDDGGKRNTQTQGNYDGDEVFWPVP